MEEAIQFFRNNEIWIYLFLGLGALWYIRKFALAWQELRGAAFGLERDSAQGRLNQAAGALVLLLTMALAEFTLVSFVAPAMPGLGALPTPTLDLLATPTVTLEVTPDELAGTPVAETQASETEPAISDPACVPDQIEITFPSDGQDISGVVPITGTADIPDFGFYKLEMKRPEETNWLTILAGNEVRREASLGTWNTSLLPPGYHQLALVIADNQGQALPPCTIQVRVTNREE